MKKSFCLLTILTSLLLIASPALTDDGFYVIAVGGKAGKVLKTQIFTSYTQDSTVGPDDEWTKLPSPQWTYTKVSDTSYLVITYQDSLYADGYSMYILSANDLFSSAPHSALLLCNSTWNFPESTGVWIGLPKGDVNLAIWHWQSGCTYCQQGAFSWGTSVLVMEIER